MKAATVISLVSLGVAAAGTVFSIVSGKKYEKYLDRYNKVMADIESQDVNLSDYVREDMVNAIIDKKVTEQLNVSVPRVEQLVANTFNVNLKSEVKREIGSQYADIKSDVKREVKEQVGHIDISDVKRQVIAEAKEEAARFFRDECRYRLDELVSDASEEIQDIVKRAKKDIEHIQDIHEMFANTTRSK